MTSRTRTRLVLRQLSRLNVTPLHYPRLIRPPLCTTCQRTFLTLRTFRPFLHRAIFPTCRRTVFIQTSPTPNDHALKFTPTEHSLLPPNTPTTEFLNTSLT